MIDDPSKIAPEASDAHGDWFMRSANLIALGALILGGLRGLQSLFVFATAPASGLAATSGAVAGACAEVLLYGLFGLAASALVRALGVWALSRSSTDRVRSPEAQLSVETSARPLTPSADVVSHPGAASQLAEIRRLLRDHDWDAATEAVRVFRDEHPADPRSAEASGELERAMQAALGRLEAQLQAAREVNDPDQVLEIHGRMAPLLDEERRNSLDVELARWFLSIVHRRLRTGRIQADVVALADRIAEGFGHTTDGASLRASLPTLRRSAGLCPRCAKPYTGVAQACPECLKPAPAPPPSFEPDELDEPAVEAHETDLFIDPYNEAGE